MTKRIIAVSIVIASIGVAVFLWPSPPEEKPPLQDTGLTRQQVEEKMRTIGYVQ